MNERVKILISVLLVLSVVCFAGAAFVYTRSETFQEQLSAARIEKEKLAQQLDAQNQKLQTQADRVGSLEQEKTVLSAEISELKVQMDQLYEKLAEEVSQYEVIQIQLQEKNQELADLKGQWEQYEQITSQLENQLKQASEEKQQLLDQNNVYGQKIASLENEVEELLQGRKSVELQQVVVTPDQEAPVAESIAMQDWFNPSGDPLIENTDNKSVDLGLSGKVLIYNKEFDFVIIDLGEEDFVQEGDEFSVYERGQNIGKIKVERVYARMSAGVVLEREPNVVFQKNHQVKSI